MIPPLITSAHIVQATQRIDSDGMPPRRRSRGYCLVTDGKHFPPKYTIAFAHRLATGEYLRSDRFSGGQESNDFLRCRGFDVIPCNCRGGHRDDRPASVSGPSETTHTIAPARHSERCRECKRRVRGLLERIYGACVPDHRFGWRTGLATYAGTSIGSALRDVATTLERYRGFGIGEFVRRDVLAGCDFWVPNPGFVVEFDERQHFTTPRKLALSVYADHLSLGFSAERWISLCECHDARDSNPPYRDEQRAWYDALRDLVPSVQGLQPTARLNARALRWCSLDPDKREDRERFSDLVRHERPPSVRTTIAVGSSTTRSAGTLRVAMVFPQVDRTSSNGVPPNGAGAQQPVLPTATSFACEAVDFVLFPEAYIRSSDDGRIRSLRKLASDLGATLLVGAIDRSVDSTGRAWQVLLRFDPDGSRPSRIYVKHSTAEAVAFERPGWEPHDTLPTLELAGVSAGATICHDHYLGLLPRFLARRGARIWVNPSFDNVTDIKWSSVLRLRAVENRFFALCTLHCDANGRRTHPFAFSPDGNELAARKAGSAVSRPMFECTEAGNIYVVELDMDAAGAPLEWAKLPLASKPKGVRNGPPRKPVHVALKGGQPAVLGCSGWHAVQPGSGVETDHGPVYVGVVPEEAVLDAAECFHVLDRAKQLECVPIIWNHWKRLPTDSGRLATLAMGRAIECCAPIVISDGDGIHELVELSNRNKIPARRVMETSGQGIVDIGNAWGLDSAFKIVTRHLPRGMRASTLEHYRIIV